MPYIFTASGLEQLQAALQTAPEVVAKRLQSAVVASAAIITRHTVRSDGIVPYRTGRLSQSIGRPPAGLEIGTLRAIVRPAVDYAIFVHEGTAPHEIMPKTKKALFWPGADHPVRKVNHPGTKPNPFMPRLLDASREEIQQQFAKAAELVVQDLTK